MIHLLWLLCLAVPVSADVSTSRQAHFATWSERNAFLATTPGVSSTGLLGYANPAVVARLRSSESLLLWNDGDDEAAADWALFSAVPGIGFSMVRGADEWRRRESRISIAGGDRTFALGGSWGWFGGARAPDPTWTIGTIWQPSRHWSVGGTFTAPRNGDFRETTAELGLRPFGSPALSLFGEIAAADGEAREVVSRPELDDLSWRVGGDWGLGPGVHVAASYDDDGQVRVGVRLELGSGGVRLGGVRRDGSSSSASYGLRLGPNRQDLRRPLMPPRPTFLQLDLHGPVRHRTGTLFDSGRSLLQLLSLLQRVQDDPSVTGVALNLSGLRIDPSMAWELRQRLQALRDTGHSIVIYIDRADLRRYHLASVADVIVLDPAGLVVLQGVAAGQVYLRGALDKLGIGSQEWRYHEYKSAFESLHRTDMSAADREQWQALLDDDYGRARADITSARDLSVAQFDSLVNEVTVFRADDALVAGLVDSVGRWSTVERVVELRGARGGLRTSLQSPPAEEGWGSPPTVAIAYALGMCAMDSGIRARALARRLHDLADDAGVAAVVLRVDSPGGDVLASDIVAGAVRSLREQKPVVVSQSRLATSGGYWISMEADDIVATPATVAGNIGVVAGWLYNDGFRQRLGVTVDHVQVGTHADLGFGMPVPFLGPLPERAMTEDEVERTDRVLQATYDDFIGRVAEARDRSVAQIDSIARGRVWAATAAHQRGLLDALGGLDLAIDLARQRAGLAADRPVQLTEWPAVNWFPFGSGLGQLVGISHKAPQEPRWASWVRFRLRHNGQPLVLLPQPLLEQTTFGTAPTDQEP